MCCENKCGGDLKNKHASFSVFTCYWTLVFYFGRRPIGYCGHLGFSESGSVEGDVQFNIRYCQIGFPRGEKSNLNGQMCQMLGSVGTK